MVSVLYAADTIEGALMQTVFHEAPTPSAGAHLRRNEIAAKGLVLSELRTTTKLQVIDLTSTGLRRVGLTKPQVIDTDANAYPDTRALAQHLYSTCPSAHGIQWSRQLDRSRAVMLFADRLPPASIAPTGPSRSVLDNRPPGAVHMPAGGVETPTTQSQQAMGNWVPLMKDIFLAAKGVLVANPLEVYTTYTGGRQYGFKTQKDLERAVSDLGEELHSQYLLTYTPTNQDEAGYHNIVVEVLRPGLKIRARDGYYWAGSKAEAAPKP